MNDLFRPYLRRFVLVFFYDILIYSATWDAHVLHLRTVLSRLASDQFVVNPKKCSWAQTSIDYLGHVISANGVRMDPSKISAVLQWPTPKSVKGVRGFLGLTGYYRRFIRNYGQLARPLTQLLRKEEATKFHWPADAEEAFLALQCAITSAPILAMPDFSQDFVVECDASGHGIGAILMQNRHPLAFFSKALSPRNASKSTYEKELMALIFAVQHWRQYLLGRRFVVRTDHQSLRHFLQQPLQSPTQQYWVSKLLGYDFIIEYRPGVTNTAADALSRREGELEAAALTIPHWVDWTRLRREVQDDPVYAPIVNDLAAGNPVRQPYTLVQGILFYKDRLAIPPGSPLVDRLLHEFHSSPVGGHAGAYRTYRRLAANV